jgi:hypothetical protein
MKTRVIAWWSGGITSALACLWAVLTFKNVVIVWQDTGNEDEDTERFRKDCEKLYGQEIIRLSRFDDVHYTPKNIEEIWFKYETLNNATGAICSTELKREVREAYQNLKTDYAQVFGFDANELKRHTNMRRNYPEINVISPLVDLRKSKADCVREFVKLGIELPRAYKYGFKNNNCLKTGCVRGGIGYWKKYKAVFPDRFEAMAKREHDLTNRKGQPVTMIRDQTNDRKGEPIFLQPHPNYPQLQSLDDKEGREPESIIECNGFCSTKD